MKRKFMNFATVSCVVMILSFNPFPVNAGNIDYATGQSYVLNEYENSIQRADIIDWRIKVEDGKVYKRLFNYSKNVWIGEWILVS